MGNGGEGGGFVVYVSGRRGGGDSCIVKNSISIKILFYGPKTRCSQLSFQPHFPCMKE